MPSYGGGLNKGGHDNFVQVVLNRHSALLHVPMETSLEPPLAGTSVVSQICHLQSLLFGTRKNRLA